MSESYLGALWQETAAWQEVEGALRGQRSAIIGRQAEAIWESQDRLQELLRVAAIAQAESRRLRPPEVDEETQVVEGQAERSRGQVRDALQLNHELLKDLCCYLDMIREVVYPRTLPPTYGNPRQRQGAYSQPGLRGSRIA